MNGLRVWSVIAIGVWVGPLAFGGATLASKALEKIGQRGPVHADSFDFVVVGDSRSAEPVVQPESFKQSIREWNVLRPAFVIDEGDLILGGSAAGLDPQWKEFEDTVAKCEPPFVPVLGNHDVSHPATEKICVDRIGLLVFCSGDGRDLLPAEV